MYSNMYHIYVFDSWFYIKCTNLCGCIYSFERNYVVILMYLILGLTHMLNILDKFSMGVVIPQFLT